MQPLLATQVSFDWANKQDLSGTGSTANSTAMEVGRWYTLFVGDNDLYIRWGSSSPTATVNDAYLGAKTTLTWQADNNSTYCAVIHQDGASAHEAMIVPSSPAP
jgi:hypothetical protein